tara:strand:+ start:2773 stop:3012 length:240 start_codon:yes stop_codon:yes gene_type:complete
MYRVMEEQEIEKLIDRAAERAVKAAMKDLGISNKDVYELHNLLSTYRAIQTSFVATITKGVTLLVLGAIGVAVYMHERI